MDFSFENTIAYANSVSLDEFVREEANRQARFIAMSRREFYAAVDKYFRFENHVLSFQQLNERRAQVFINFFFLFERFIFRLEINGFCNDVID